MSENEGLVALNIDAGSDVIELLLLHDRLGAKQIVEVDGMTAMGIH
jgi:hypothetical protein